MLQFPDIASIAKFLAAYGAGAVTAGFFLSGPGERPGNLQQPGPPPAYQQPAEPQEPQVREIPIERPYRAETTGSGSPHRETMRGLVQAPGEDPGIEPSPCNIAACQLQYRTFDPRTCTYRSFEGDVRRCTE
jgi:hypothetical protein